MSKNEINKKESGKDNAYAYISIVAIVAIVAVFVVFTGNNKTQPVFTGDLVGDARHIPATSRDYVNTHISTQGPPTVQTGSCGPDPELMRIINDQETLVKIINEIEREGGEVLRNFNQADLERRHGRVVREEILSDHLKVTEFEDGTIRSSICYCDTFGGSCIYQSDTDCVKQSCSSNCAEASNQGTIFFDKLSNIFEIFK